MQDSTALNRCLAFVNCQVRPPAWPSPVIGEPPRLRAVTISRQTGCGALAVADQLARLLQQRYPSSAPPWTVFDRNLMEKVLEDHHLPARLAKLLPEDRITEVQDIIDELFGLHPPSWILIQQTSETILHLAELGNVILIGRGANVVTARLPGVIHVRLVAPTARRIQRCHDDGTMNLREAGKFVAREDLGRRRYLKKYFKSDIDDPLLYHLVLNIGRISFDEAARIVADAGLMLAGSRR